MTMLATSVRFHTLIMAIAAMTTIGCATPPIENFDNSYTLTNEDKLIAFVGEKIAIEKFDPQQEYEKQRKDEEKPEDEIIIFMDAGFRARYKILSLAHGDYTDEYVDFVAYDHYGFPPFAEQKVAMLYLTEVDGSLYHWKYTWDAVHPTKNGRYAFCGDAYLNIPDHWKSRADRGNITAIKFEPPVVYDISEYRISPKDAHEYSESEIAENEQFIREFFYSSAFDIKGDKATCRKGVYPEELFRLKSESILYWSRRFDSCKEKLGITRLYKRDSSEWKAIDECIADLKQRDQIK